MLAHANIRVVCIMSNKMWESKFTYFGHSFKRFACYVCINIEIRFKDMESSGEHQSQVNDSPSASCWDISARTWHIDNRLNMIYDGHFTKSLNPDNTNGFGHINSTVCTVYQQLRYSVWRAVLQEKERNNLKSVCFRVLLFYYLSLPFYSPPLSCAVVSLPAVDDFKSHPNRGREVPKVLHTHTEIIGIVTYTSWMSSLKHYPLE